MPPSLVALLRISLAAVIITLIAVSLRKPLPAKKLLGHIAIFGLFGLVLPYTLFPIAEQTISSSLTGSLNATTPIWTLFLTWIFARKNISKPTPLKLAGLLLGLVGVVIMLRPWESTGTLWGSCAALGGACCYGISNVYVTKYLSNNVDAITLATTQMIFAALICAATVPIGPIFFNPKPLTFFAIGFLGILGTGFAQAIYVRMIHDDGALSASTVTYLVPVVAILVGVIFLHEAVPFSTYAGIAVTLIGVSLSRR